MALCVRCRFTSSRLRSLVADHDAAAEAKEKALSSILKVGGGAWCRSHGHYVMSNFL